MSNSFWNFVTQFVPGGLAKAEEVNTNLTGIASGLDLVETELGKSLQVTNAAGVTDIVLNAAARAGKLISFDINGDLAATTIMGDWKGDHADSEGTDYQIRDVVRDSQGDIDLASLYICIETHTSTGNILADTAKWELLLASSTNIAENVTLDNTGLIVVDETNVKDWILGADAALLKARGTGVTSTYVNTATPGGTTFDQAAVNGEMSSDEGYASFSYAGATGVTVSDLTASSTYVYIDKNGDLGQQTTIPTRQDKTRKAFTMRIGVNAVLETIIGFEYYNNPIGHYTNTMRDIYEYLRAAGVSFRKEQLITGRADLGFDVSAGSLLELGGTGNIFNPNEKPFDAATNVSYNLMSRTAFVSAETNLQKVWDNAETITALGSTTFVGHRLYRFSSGNFAMQYGQGNYANLLLAKAGVLTEEYVLNPALKDATFFGWWIVSLEATTTDGTTQTSFREYTIGLQGGSSSSLSGAVLRGNNASDFEDYDLVRTNLGIRGALDKRYSPIFATVAAMTDATPIAIDGLSVTFTVGMKVATLGYRAAGDGGAGDYLAVAAQAFDGYIDHEEATGIILVLQPVTHGIYNMRQCGATGDGTGVGDGEAKTAIMAKLVAAGGGTLLAPIGHYIVDSLGYSGPSRINIIGSATGVAHWQEAGINDTTNVTRFSQTAGQTGIFADFTAPDDTTLNGGGGCTVENLLLLGAASNTNSVMRVKYFTKAFDMSNIWIAVHQDATDCDGLEIMDSWIISYKNITIRHGSENGAQGTRSTGKGFFLHNIDGDGVGGALNQLNFDNLNVQYFARNVQVGDITDASVKSININSVVFMGGASQFAEEWNVWMGSGIETINYLGFHTEFGGQSADGSVYAKGGGITIGNGAFQTLFKGSKHHSNSRNAYTHDVYFRGDTNLVIFEQQYFSGIADGAICIEGSLVASTETVILRDCNFIPTTDGTGTVIGFSSGTGRIKNFVHENLTLEKGSLRMGTFAANAYILQTPVRARVKNNQTADYTIATNDNRFFGSNLGASGTVTFTLPAASTILPEDLPFACSFIKEADQTLSVDINASDTLVYPGVSTSATYRANTSGQTGNVLEVELLDISTAKWVVTRQTGTWAVV
jgi:hypothetical protein